MQFILGYETVTAKNDGGLHIMHWNREGEHGWRRHERVIPVLSLEI